MNIVITGANQGIGYFMVEELLNQGHTVTVLDIEINLLQKLIEKYPHKILPILCDVRNTKRMQESIVQSVNTFGLIDIAIHNACICTFQSMEEADYNVYEDVMNVNYFGALRLAKCTIPHMKNGKVIFVSSGVGVTGFHSISPYASSKGAIESLAKCLSLEYKNKGISFHIMQPPLTKTKSAQPIPIPQEFLANPQVVGHGLAKRMHKKTYCICHSFIQQIQMKLCYLFPLKMGVMMSKMTKRSKA